MNCWWCGDLGEITQTTIARPHPTSWTSQDDQTCSLRDVQITNRGRSSDGLETQNNHLTPTSHTVSAPTHAVNRTQMRVQ